MKNLEFRTLEKKGGGWDLRAIKILWAGGFGDIEDFRGGLRF